MRKRKRQQNQENLLPLCIIQAASEGDVDAINVVLKHYEGYIAKLATRNPLIVRSPRRASRTRRAFSSGVCCFLAIVELLSLWLYDRWNPT